MENKSICITTDCACDLPEQLLKNNNIDIVYFYIQTDTGNFRDMDEMNSVNMFDYLQDEDKHVVTKAPSVADFEAFFSNKLKEYDEVIHIAISSKVSQCVKNSSKAAREMKEYGKRIHIVDSWHVSTGLGLLVLHATKLLRSNKEPEDIISDIKVMRNIVSTTFLVNSADYLYKNGKIGKNIRWFCNLFHIHPVLKMEKGFMKLKAIYVGSYEQCTADYIRKELKKSKRINTHKLFITHAACSVSDLSYIKQEIERYVKFDSVDVTKTSATVAGNCGPGTFGLAFQKKIMTSDL